MEHHDQTAPRDEGIPCCVLTHPGSSKRYERLIESLPGEEVERVNTIGGVRAFVESNTQGLVLVTQGWLDRQRSWEGAAEVIRLCRADLHPVMLVLEDAAPAITVARGFDYGFDDVLFLLCPQHEIAARVRRVGRMASEARWLRDRQGIDPDTNLLARSTAGHFLIGSLSYARRTGTAISLSVISWELTPSGDPPATPACTRSIRKQIASVLSGVLRPYDSVFAMNDRCFLVIWTALAEADAQGVNRRMSEMLQKSVAEDGIEFSIEWHVPPDDLDRYPEKIPGYLDGLTVRGGLDVTTSRYG